MIIKSLYQALACGALAALRLVTELCCVGGGILFHLLLAGVFRAWSTSKLRQMWGFNKTSNSIVLNQQNPGDFWGKIPPLSRYSIKHQHSHREFNQCHFCSTTAPRDGRGWEASFDPPRAQQFLFLILVPLSEHQGMLSTAEGMRKGLGPGLSLLLRVTPLISESNLHG